MKAWAEAKLVELDIEMTENFRAGAPTFDQYNKGDGNAALDAVCDIYGLTSIPVPGDPYTSGKDADFNVSIKG